MTTSESSRRRTRAFARVLGPFFTIAAVVALLRAPDRQQMLTEFTASLVWPWVLGAFGLMGGLAIVAFHQYWRGAAAIIVSLLGWILVARGVFLLAFPDALASWADGTVGDPDVSKAVYLLFAAIGVYLTYVGWKPESKETEHATSHAIKDLPRAA